MPQTEALNSFLTFRLGDELFAASVSKVIEILEIPKITKVPRSPDFMRGVINLRGSVLPVIDTRLKFGLPLAEDTINSCIIVMSVVVEEETITIGAMADAVEEVMEIEESHIQPAPSMGAKYKTEFINGMVKRGDHFIMLLDINLVFSTQEATILKDFTGKTSDISNNR
jgi:purine-binding chemotaxis protein CheW